MRSLRGQLVDGQWEQAMAMQRLQQNPFDADAQRKIEEMIQAQRIADNMAHAMEYHPESFGSVTMLYVTCRVNGKELKAFVDCGAQATISIIDPSPNAID